MNDAFAIACSGPGAGAVIRNAINYGYFSAAVTLPLLILAATIWLVVRRNFYAAILTLAPTAIHPAWAVSAIGGDCGILKVSYSHMAIGLAMVLLGIAVVVAITRGFSHSRPITFSLRALFAATFAVAVAMLLVRADAYEWLPQIIFVAMLSMGIWPLFRNVYHRFLAERPAQVKIQRHSTPPIREETIEIRSNVADRYHG